MAKYMFLVDLNYCISCHACEVACKTWNNVPTDRGIRWRQVVNEVFGEGADVLQYAVSLACNHCNEAPCVKACPTGAMYRRAQDGIVLVDQQKCIGCRYCAAVCPYGAPQFDPVAKKTSKCTMCVDRLSEGKLPACVDTCPTQALQFGEASEIARRGVRQITRFPNPLYSDPSIRFIPKEV